MRTTLGLGTAATQNTGTSGATIPLLSTQNTWGGVNTFGTGTTGMNLVINAAQATSASLFGQKVGLSRWAAILGNATAESGSNAGSDLVINRYDDSGAFIGSAVTINRSTGVMSLSAALPIASGGTGATNIAAFKTSLAYGTAANYNTGTSGGTVPLLNTANTWSGAQTISGNLALTFDASAAANRGMNFSTTGSLRWRLFASATAEGGSNAGSNFTLNAYDDAGIFLYTPLSVSRATGTVTISSLLLSTALPLASGGTGSATAAGARTNLGLGTAATVNTGTSGAVIPLLSTANTWSGTQTFGAGTGDASIIINSAAPNNSYIMGTKAASIRWRVFLGNSEAETGSNAGSNFHIDCYNDAGVYLGKAIQINRTDRIVQAVAGIATPQINGSPLKDFRNQIINGNFDIWQRATSQTTSGYASSDRWSNLNGGSTKTTSRQTSTFGQTTIPGQPTYYHRTVVSSVAAAGNYVRTEQHIEDVSTLAGKTATLTWWARADAARPMSVEMTQFFGTGGSPSATVTAFSVTKVNLTTTFAKYTAVFAIPSVLGKTIGTAGNDALYVRFWFDAGSTYNTNTSSLGQQSGTFDIARVSLVEGDASLEPDAYTPRSIAQEIILCQRFFEIGRLYARFDGTIGAAGVSGGASVTHAVQKKSTTPAATIVGTTYTNSGSASVFGANESNVYFNWQWTTDGVVSRSIIIGYWIDSEI
jgi:hypothetical protein